MFNHRGNALMKFLSEFADLLCIFCYLFLPPAIVHSPQERNKGCWCCQDDALINALFN